MDTASEEVKVGVYKMHRLGGTPIEFVKKKTQYLFRHV